MDHLGEQENQQGTIVMRSREEEGAEVALREQELDARVQQPGWYRVLCMASPNKPTPS